MRLGRVLLIVNPASRRGARQHPAALAAFADAGVECEVVFTEHPGHAALIAFDTRADYDALFTLGGDGTVMEVLGVLAGRDIPVGVLPGGTGNLLARALDIPLNLRRAVTRLVAGEVKRVDLGALANGRVFAFAAGVGIDATMVARTSGRKKRTFGVLAYMATAASASFRLDSFTMQAKVDGVSHTFQATAALVANFGSVLSGLIRLGPGISPDDGMLDLCVFSPRNVTDALRLGWRIARKDFSADPAMHFLKGRTIRIETDLPRPAQADGEMIGMTPLDAHVLPLAARLLVPR